MSDAVPHDPTEPAFDPVARLMAVIEAVLLGLLAAYPWLRFLPEFSRALRAIPTRFAALCATPPGAEPSDSGRDPSPPAAVRDSSDTPRSRAAGIAARRDRHARAAAPARPGPLPVAAAARPAPAIAARIDSGRVAAADPPPCARSPFPPVRVGARKIAPMLTRDSRAHFVALS